MSSSISAEASPSSVGSSSAITTRRPASLRDDADADHHEAPSAVPLERLVGYLMEAKRSLASMHQLVQAGNMVARATDYHERAVKLSADGTFLYWGLASLVQQLDAMKRGFIRTYDNQKKKFDDNIHLLDASAGRLTGILDKLKNTPVDPVFRPEGEESKNLKDFVDEANVHNLINALKDCINELKAAETSFAGDIFRLETDITAVKARMKAVAIPDLSPSPDHLMQLSERSFQMSQTLVSLTQHFDKCVKAVRESEGGMELALRIDAEASQEASYNDGVQLPSLTHRLQPDDHPNPKHDLMSSAELNELVQIVVEDAAEVQPTVREMGATLESMIPILAASREQLETCEAVCTALVDAFYHAESVRRKMASYQAAEREFRERIAAEQDTIDTCESQVTELTHFYEGYINAYGQLKTEYRRRQALDEKIQAILQKAADAVEFYREQDRVARQNVESSFGAFLPRDLWVKMDEPMREFRVILDPKSPEAAAATSPPLAAAQTTATAGSRDTGDSGDPASG